MTTSPSDAALRQWLADYLVANVGCDAADLDPDSSFSDLGLGSRDALVLAGELAELLGRKVSPLEFWQHPTINAMVDHLTTAESLSAADGASSTGRGPVDEPIAVVGLGCRFPGGICGPESLWQFLSEGRCPIQEVPADRWRPFDDGSPEVAAVLARTTRWGAFLDDVDAFDAEFFDISLREAAKMDPQQRLLLEVAWEALEYAGIPPSSLSRSQTGVFVGASFSEYGYLTSSDLPGVDAWNNIGGALSIIANRLSYFLDLRGPSVTVDTACSSSLVALHLACQSLRTSDSQVAVAAGVNLLLSPAVFAGFDEAGALSPTGVCRSFDADADGFVRGEGAGVVVLKRLSDATRDGNRVLAVVRGSAVNSDGRSNGLMAPNPAAQMAVLRAAYANSGVDAHEVDYVETHGTGTLLGDPIEARALGSVLGRGRPKRSPLLIGAIKTNLGHLEAAAGIAGFIKAVLALQRATIPENLNFATPNPHIPFDEIGLKVVAEQQQWPPVDRVRRAGVSSFGFGGTNAHVVIEQAPVFEPQDVQTDPPVSTLVITGRTPERIASTAAALADWMAGAGAGARLADAAHTINHHRASHAQFATVCARDRADAVAGLRAIAGGGSAVGVVGPHDGQCGPGTVFVYSGQGSHWAGMGWQLLSDEAAFAAAVDEIEPPFVEHVGFSLRQVLAEGQPISGDARVQPVIMALQLALTQLWASYGVTPDAVVGHSMGEVTAAVVSGALSPADGLRVIATRSRLMSQLAGQGAVALLGLDAEATAALIAEHPAVSLAGYISPRQTVIAGPVAAVDLVIATVSDQNCLARRVNMEVASHTASMDPVLPQLRAALADLSPAPPKIPLISSVADVTTTPVLDAEYWVSNLRQPMRLHQAIAAAARDHAMFIEVSPHPTLTHAISATCESVAAHHHSIGTLWRDGDDTVSFHTNLNATHTTHPPPTPHPPEPHPVLPSTPWHHTRHWIDAAPVRRRSGPADNRPAQTSAVVPAEWCCTLTWPTCPLPAATPAAEGRWLVVADTALGAEFSRTLDGGDALTVLPPSVLAYGAGRAALADALGGVSHVVFAPDVAAGCFDAAPGYELFNEARRLSAALSAMTLPPRLFMLTRNAQPIGAGDRANPAHAVLWGLGRTLAVEQPEIWGAIVDVDESVPAELVARYVVAEARGGGGEDQVVYRAGGRHVPRLSRRTLPAVSPVEFDTTHCHLVIGAAGKIGPYLIRQLADMGAATIVAVSRNPGSRLDELAAGLSANGTALVTVAADATDEAAMSALFDRFGADLPPLGGIYLAAYGGGPVMLHDMTDDDVTTMFAPKLDAVSLLHKLSLHQPVGQFVMFTSISGVLGSRWLGHYAATTTFLDTFAYARRAAGLPATAVNWGSWKSLADNQTDQELQVTVKSGLEPMPDEVAIQALWSLTGPDAPVRCTIVAADWARLAAAYRTRAPFHIVDELLAGESDGCIASTPSTAFRDALRECEPQRRHDLLLDHINAQVCAAMGLASPEPLDPSAGFFQSGMDSLMSVTLQRSLAESLGETLPTSVVFDYPTVGALAGYLATILPELIEAADQQSIGVYDAFTDDELLQQLSDRLS
jgi:phthiocerol/phenolphthiocerol synthesis type-I polyketide synthase B